ncbi:RecQ family ATP-dependent DNA helicase [Thermosynechococcus sp. HN-54]|uniref:RecQ family ATP-dependent DNA helicase n=1 Tax=Thermosynechococcus sp. HN-54 TaxID=2933959 RepID=UPI00202CDDBC|nr:RecQ family ATP-dependent DNA helicase [Thermosynechococcus sp. HN-54]URR35239.1 RecQ family ATP-dependent DNA helicase [Thermosynechococcus sp. HN-54]
MSDAQLERIQAALQDYWGYSELRSPQAEVMAALLQRQDALIVLPTGAGKSLCFQLPALLQGGLTLVISPLLALMENQITELRQRGLAAAAYHSELPSSQRRQILSHLRDYRLLYLSPESLFSSPLWQRLCSAQVHLNGLIVDEAHCLVQWGDRFRPVYRRLGTVRPTLRQCKPQHPPLAIAAFTATADPRTQRTLIEVLGLKQPVQVIHSPYRANLHLAVRSVWSRGYRRHCLQQFLNEQQGASGLIYARTRRDCESLAMWLSQQGYCTTAYHGGLPAAQRRSIEAAWLEGHIPFVVCTNAFGMGVNKANVRWICHYQPPLQLSEYLQEVGRAGRDGQPAQALALVSDRWGLDREDQQRWQFFQRQSKEIYARAMALQARLPLKGNLQELRQHFPEVELTLALLHQQGRLRWQDPFHYCRQPLAQVPPPPQNTQEQLMQEFLYHRGCRWQFLLQAFGFATEARGLRCGHCDRCRLPRRSCKIP